MVLGVSGHCFLCILTRLFTSFSHEFTQRKVSLMTKNKTKIMITSLFGLWPLMAEAQSDIAAICQQDGIECQQSEAGIVIGKPNSTGDYDDSVHRAAKLYETNFGVNPPKAAVILGDVLSQEQIALVRQSYDIVLPWMTEEDKTAMMRNVIKRQVKEQRPNLSNDQLNAIVERSLKASNAANGIGNDAAELHQGVFSHELGHLYFINQYWPNEEVDVASHASDAGPARYAGPGPDWLDEMAAVLSETEVLTEKRRKGIKTAFDAHGKDAFWSMKSYFSITHPAFEKAREIIKARQNTAEGRAKGGVVVMSGHDAETPAGERAGINYYYQSRAFADYMIAQSSNPKIFADVATALSQGQSMDQWLATNRFGLATTVSSLEDDFFAWVIEHYKVNYKG